MYVQSRDQLKWKHKKSVKYVQSRQALEPKGTKDEIRGRLYVTNNDRDIEAPKDI